VFFGRRCHQAYVVAGTKPLILMEMEELLTLEAQMYNPSTTSEEQNTIDNSIPVSSSDPYAMHFERMHLTNEAVASKQQDNAKKTIIKSQAKKKALPYKFKAGDQVLVSIKKPGQIKKVTICHP
jgi:ribosomal protein S3AE